MTTPARARPVHRPQRARRALVNRPARVLAVAAALVAGAAVPVVTGATAGGVPAPSQWPSSSALAPTIETWTNAIRFAGPDREQTALALVLGLRGAGDYPFDTPDPSSGGAPTLGAADDWWGVGSCPRSIIVVAGDVPADSLAAAALSDPSDRSTEPYLRRSASADPLFDPVGGFNRVDTESAPIIVTRSARAGATGLGTAARLAARDLRSGGCTLARQAIIVGGTAAVPAGVDAELVGLGYDEVFRVGGADRYATAAAVAAALGTGTATTTATPCDDPAVDDGAARMGFYGNAAIEWRTSAAQCRVLRRTVVLADGITGADALAAGWWTSFWQVPVLLHDGSEQLPAATVAALSTLGVDHVVVLGGPARIPVTVADQAGDLTGGTVERLAGSDRYATSVEMARRLGGWWPTGRADEYSGSLVCLAASSGNGPGARGWPDALAAGPWCAAAGGAASRATGPLRALGPLTGEAPGVVSGAVPAHDAVPVLLVPAGATTLPASVADLLSSAFEPTDSFCSSVQAPSGCTKPGFVVAAGGPAVLPAAVIAAAARHVAGGTPADGTVIPGALTEPFHTALDLSPVYASAAAPDHVCVARGGYADARWLAVLGAPSAPAVITAADAMLAGRYVRDADGVTRSRGVGAPLCTAFDAGTRPTVRARAVGIAGRTGPEQTFAISASDRLRLTAPVTDDGPDSASGTSSSTDDSAGGTTTQTYVTVAPTAAAVSRGSAIAIASAAITFTITRGTDGPSATGIDRYTAAITIDTPSGTITATSSGEALLVGGVWRLRGRVVITGGTWNLTAGSGGFTADLDPGATTDPGDDTISWRLDAVAD